MTMRCGRRQKFHLAALRTANNYICRLLQFQRGYCRDSLAFKQFVYNLNVSGSAKFHGFPQNKKLTGKARKADESMMLVKSGGLMVNGINHDGGPGDLTMQTSLQSIGEQNFSQTTAMTALISRKAAKQRGRNHRIFGHHPNQIIRQILELNARHRKGVVTLDELRSTFHHHEKSGDIPARILAGLLLEIAIQGIVSATKSRSVMIATERLNDERRQAGCVAQDDSPINSSCRFMAAIKASFGGGGFSSDSTKTC